MEQDSLLVDILRKIDSIDNTLTGQAVEIQHHINRTDILQGQVEWMQWVIPVCFTMLAVFISIPNIMKEVRKGKK